MSLPDPQSFFTEIRNEAEKHKIYAELAEHGYEAKVKFLKKGLSLFLVKPFEYDQNHQLLTTRIVGTVDLSRPGSEVIFQFNLGDKLYMTQSPVKIYDQQIVVKTQSKLFRVQRRDSFRVNLPKEFRGKLRIDLLDNQVHKREYHIVDLSGGGCRFESQVSGIDIHQNQSWSGSLMIPDYPVLSLHGKIRHVAAHPNLHNVQWIGTAFDNLKLATRNQIEGIVMDLYRNFFSHL